MTWLCLISFPFFRPESLPQITGDYRGLVQLQNVKELLPQKQWKVKEAVYMAKAKFRNSYIRNNFC